MCEGLRRGMCDARGARGLLRARTMQPFAIVSRVTLHRFTFHVARNRLRQFFIQFPLGRSAGRGAGRFLPLAPPRRSFAYGPPLSSPPAPTYIAHATTRRRAHSARQVSAEQCAELNNYLGLKVGITSGVNFLKPPKTWSLLR